MDQIEFINTTKAYLAIAKEINALEAKKKQMSAKLLQHLKDNGFTKLLCEGVGDVHIVNSKKDTPQVKMIEDKFNIVLTSDCFKHSEYEYIKVLPMPFDT